jgi:flagella basal body P-ring formation protein FlgA
MRFPYFFRYIAVLAASGISTSGASASAMEDAASLGKVAETFVLSQTRSLPGQVSVAAGAVDTRLRLPKCANAEGFLPPGARLWGNATVGIRCSQPSAWTIYLPVTVKVMAPLASAAKHLPQGHVITAADIVMQPGDLTQFPPGAITDAQQVVGKVLASSISAGQVLRPEQLRAPQLVKTGQNVRLVAQGDSFQVSAEGKALNNAGAGQSVSVRTAGGKVVSGVVRADGAVEVNF